jgi:hypothetical protein
MAEKHAAKKRLVSRDAEGWEADSRVGEGAAMDTASDINDINVSI